MSSLPSKTARLGGYAAFVVAFATLCLLTTLMPERAVGDQARPTDATLRTSACPAPCAESANADAGPWGSPVQADNFNGSSLDRSGWFVYDYPNGTPRRLGANVRTRDGELQLVGTYNRKTNAQFGSGVSSDLNQKYGRWEVRARGDKGRGFSPTILLWPEENNWPAGGEIDLLETPRGDRSKPIAVVHNGPANFFQTHAYPGDHSEWHTYAVEWLPSRVTFFLDGAEVWNVTDKSLIPTAAPMHLVLQNDAGCAWIQCPDANTQAETVMHVDWVRVYRAPAGPLG